MCVLLLLCGRGLEGGERFFTVRGFAPLSLKNAFGLRRGVKSRLRG